MRIQAVQQRIDLFRQNQLNEVWQVVLASCFISISAQICIPLYFTPVPLTGQTFGVLLVGALLGSRKGVLATLLYLYEGAMGLPVFAGGSGGVHHFFGFTGGYLFAFVLEAYCMGRFLEGRRELSVAKITWLCMIASCMQMGIGVLWLSYFMTMKKAFTLGFVPFLAGSLLKSWAVAIIYKEWRE